MCQCHTMCQNEGDMQVQVAHSKKIPLDEKKFLHGVPPFFSGGTPGGGGGGGGGGYEKKIRANFFSTPPPPRPPAFEGTANSRQLPVSVTVVR